jgi:hypothetical protein
LRRIFGLKRDKIIKYIGEDCVMRSFAENNQNDQVKKDEMDRACSTYSGGQKCIDLEDFGVKTKGKKH